MKQKTIQMFLFLQWMKTLQLNRTLQPDMESVQIGWNKVETTIGQVEKDFHQFVVHSQELKTRFDEDLNSIEREIVSAEKACKVQVRRKIEGKEIFILFSIGIFPEKTERNSFFDRKTQRKTERTRWNRRQLPKSFVAFRTSSVDARTVKSSNENSLQLFLFEFRIDHLNERIEKIQLELKNSIESFALNSINGNDQIQSVKRQVRKREIFRSFDEFNESKSFVRRRF